IQSPMVDRVTLSRNLHTPYEAALNFISKYADLWDAPPRRSSPEPEERDASAAVARANYHRGAVSEAVANALIHRDLALRDIQTRLHIFDRAIEVVNPRRSAGFAPRALKAIRFGVNEGLNPQTASIFANAGYGLNLS